MHLAALVSLALAAAPATVSAAGRLGFALGTKRPSGECKETADYEADFDALKGLTSIVRGYDATDCNFAERALPAAQKKGFQVVLGIWADVDAQFNDGKAAAQKFSAQYPDQVHAVTVGSEALYRGNFTGDELAEKILEVKEAVGDVKVGTADSWNKIADGTADPVIRVSDFIYCNAFAYWQGQEIKNASATFFDDIQQALGRAQSVKKDIEFAVGETGWPTGGSNYGAAVVGFENAETFWKEGICGMLAWGVDVFAFEAFDEPHKPVSVGDNGEAKDETHWGVFEEDRSQKYDLSCKA